MTRRRTLWIALAAMAGAGMRIDAAGPPLDPRRIVDLTYTLGPDTPYWPGGKYHPFKSEAIATLDADGVYSRAYCTPEHLGTHLDAPNHFEKGQIAIDQIPLADLMAPAVVLDISEKAAKDADALLTLEQLRAWEARHGQVPKGSIVLLRTGWGRRAADAVSYRNMDPEGRLHFPSFASDAATYLVGPREAKALGIDTLSIDAGISKDFPVHHVVNAAGRYGLENLANLEKLPATGAYLIVAPMKIGGGTGGQARVFALLP